MVRHAVRHVRASMEQVVEQLLADYDWTGPTPPFGTAPFTVRLQAPKRSDLKPPEDNVVFISHGDEPDYGDVQLGGGLLSVEHVLFVDILAVKPAIALAVASDIKDRLSGLIGGSRFLRPVDAGTGQELFGFLGEFTDITREQPNPDLGAWQSVKATLALEFPGDIA